MTEQTNILILSCGTRNKIIQYFKNTLGNNGMVIAADSSEFAPALYEADKYYIIPKINEEGYLDVIMRICKENKVKGILTLIDSEIEIVAQNKDKFLAIGTTPIVSNYKTVGMCFDKFLFYQFLIKYGFKAIQSYVDKELFYKDIELGIIDYPVFVKPVRGSASLNINRVTSNQEIEILFNKYDDLMIQEFMNGTEYGADVYIDMITGQPVSVFVKEKIKMRAGETDKSVSYKDAELFDLIMRFLKVAGFKGIIDIDIFKVDGEYYISEVNPRFGGGYPHAYECGVNMPSMIINNLEKKENKSRIGTYDKGIYMMKYNEVMITGGSNN